MKKNIPAIIHKEEGFLVLNKPSGMLVNKADTAKDEYTVKDFIQ